MNLRPLLLAPLLGLALAAAVSGARADELDEVTRLHHTGQSAEALARADQFLAAHPRDAQMRFLKAVILADSGRSADAIAVLERLAEEHPDLAEPYNNLAVLYAAGGDYDKARADLEQALRLKPGYAAAHENLGDVYAALAARSYATAQRLEPGRADLGAKLAAVRQAITPKREAAATAPNEASGATAPPPR